MKAQLLVHIFNIMINLVQSVILRISGITKLNARHMLARPTELSHQDLISLLEFNVVINPSFQLSQVQVSANSLT